MVTQLDILKMGSTHGELSAEHGDFEHWFIARLGCTREPRVLRPESLPPPGEVQALLITGSSAMVTEPSPDEAGAMEWLKAVLARPDRPPILGVCYGHQMLAAALGGEVGWLSGGPEFGNPLIRFENPLWHDDPLFGHCPQRLRAYASHYQTVRRLPPGAVSLARSDREPHQCVRFADKAWGVQFHPEFSPTVAIEYLERGRSELAKLRLDPEMLIAECREEGGSAQILTRFAELAGTR